MSVRTLPISILTIRIHTRFPLHNLPVSRIRQAIIPAIIINLHPPLTRRRNREELAKRPVHARAHNEPAEEVQVVDVRRTNRHAPPNRAREPDNIDQNARNIRHIPAPMDAEAVIIRSRFLRRVEVAHLQVALAYEVVISDDDTRDRRQEHAVRAQVGGEVVAAAQQVPGTHGQPDSGADVAAASDRQVARQQRRHVCAGRDAVGGDVGAQLGEGEGECDDEDAEARAGRHALLVQEVLEKRQGRPDRGAVDDGGGGGHDDADEGGHGETDGDRNQLRPQRRARGFREAREVRVVDDEGGEVGDGAHDALYDCPAEGRARERRGLVDDGADAVGAHDGPDEEGEARAGGYDRFGGEEVPDLVHGEPDCGEREEPEEEEGDEVSGIGAGGGGHGVSTASTAVVVPGWPDAAEHEIDACPWWEVLVLQCTM